MPAHQPHRRPCGCGAGVRSVLRGGTCGGGAGHTASPPFAGIRAHGRPRSWLRRLLLAALFLVGMFGLMAAAAGSAQASPGSGPSTWLGDGPDGSSGCPNPDDLWWQSVAGADIDWDAPQWDECPADRRASVEEASRSERADLPALAE